jgi:hypothetical protein
MFGTQNKSPEDTPFSFDEAMRRLVYLMGGGAAIVLVYPVCVPCCYWITASVSLLIASASAVGAGSYRLSLWRPVQPRHRQRRRAQGPRSDR